MITLPSVIFGTSCPVNHGWSVWPGLRVDPHYDFGTIKIFNFFSNFPLGTVSLTGSLIKDISPYHPSAIFKSFFSRKGIINRSWSCPVKTGGSYILIHWLPLRYVFVRLLYLNKTFNFKKKTPFFRTTSGFLRMGRSSNPVLVLRCAYGLGMRWSIT